MPSQIMWPSQPKLFVTVIYALHISKLLLWCEGKHLRCIGWKYSGLVLNVATNQKTHTFELRVIIVFCIHGAPDCVRLLFHDFIS